MKTNKIVVGVDIGGTHITASLVDLYKDELLRSSLTRIDCNSKADALEILSTWRECIYKCIENEGIEKITGIGIAMPGPFDYENGVSLIDSLGKFDSLYGINIKQYLSTSFKIPTKYVKFLNDASCFGLGEHYYGASRYYSRIISITLGSGIGSSFIENGRLVTDRNDVPKNGWLYYLPYANSIADDYFSERWFLSRYKELTESECDNVLQIASSPTIKYICEEFAVNLALFLKPWIISFQADCVTIGGSLSKLENHFLPLLRTILKNMGVIVEINITELFEDAALLGSAALFKIEESVDDVAYRIPQPTLPLYKNKENNDAYDMYPTFCCDYESDGNCIQVGFDELSSLISKHSFVMIDGYVGVLFNNIQDKIDQLLQNSGISVIWKDSKSALKSQNEIDKLIQPYLGGDDPLFGKRCELNLIDFYDEKKLERLRKQENVQLNIVIGIGASLLQWDGPIIYFDLPKNEIQYRSRAKCIKNFTIDRYLSSKESYKRFYFIDWPVLNNHKKNILSKINIYVDEQHFNNPLWINGDILRKLLTKISKNYIRVRPWFEPGAWGGTWIKKNVPNVRQDTVNFAWSFELITFENGVLLENNGIILEIPFDLLMYHDGESILGEHDVKIFGDEFPIRFDFLDTFDGQNLSVQCHPSKTYISEHFGEKMAQDESYYILDSIPGSTVYLGFQDNIEIDEFRETVEKSARTSTAIDVEQYVQKHNSHKHDLFLIPHGTIHCSGKNNLVLEISSAPYIFTFKIYDWVRLDLDGKPRTLNIKRAFENLNFSRKGDNVENELISKPILIQAASDWSIYHLPTHSEQFYDVHRIEFLSEIELHTNNQCFVMMIVEGDSITLTTKYGLKQIFHYAETFILPAALDKCNIKNNTNKLCKLVKAFIKRK